MTDTVAPTMYGSGVQDARARGKNERCGKRACDWFENEAWPERPVAATTTTTATVATTTIANGQSSSSPPTASRRTLPSPVHRDDGATIGKRPGKGSLRQPTAIGTPRTHTKSRRPAKEIWFPGSGRLWPVVRNGLRTIGITRSIKGQWRTHIFVYTRGHEL